MADRLDRLMGAAASENVTQLCKDNLHERCGGAIDGETGACQCVCHYRKAADIAHETLERYARDGRTAKDFRLHAIAICHSAMQFRMRRVVDFLQQRMVSGVPVTQPMTIEPVGAEEIDDAQAMLFTVYERGLEDGLRRGITTGEERERGRVEGLARLRAAGRAWDKTVARPKSKKRLKAAARPQRTLSAAARKRISVAQKRRWKKLKKA